MRSRAPKGPLLAAITINNIDSAMAYTKYEDVNQVLEKMVAGIKDITGDNLVGIYLHGSLALGDFDPDNSDIDFMVVLREKLSDEQVERMGEMHQQLIDSGEEWGKKLEGSYVTMEQLKSEEPPFDSRPYLNEKTFYPAADYGYEWVLEKYAVREKGIGLYGPEPKEVIERVEVDDVLAAVRRIFQDNWEPMLLDPKKLESDWYQPYAILTLCRIMYAVEKGKIGSKQEAAGWVIENFGDRWRDVVDLALKWKRGDSFGQVGDVLSMIKYVGDFIKNK